RSIRDVYHRLILIQSKHHRATSGDSLLVAFRNFLREGSELSTHQIDGPGFRRSRKPLVAAAAAIGGASLVVAAPAGVSLLTAATAQAAPVAPVAPAPQAPFDLDPWYFFGNGYAPTPPRLAAATF